MNFQDVIFENSFGNPSQLGKSDMPEIVFSGKSNVGKSSLINKLIQRKSLARVSATPGKTATINFYKLRDCRFVDLPGYGYAKVSKVEKAKWGKIVDHYLSTDRKIKLVIQILDIRHKPSLDDMDMLNYLLETEYPFLVVCTKIDKLNKAETEAQMQYYSEFFSEVDVKFIPFSAVKGTGLDDVKAFIEDAVFRNEEKEIMPLDFLRTDPKNGHLNISGCDTILLSEKYGTPLYVMSEDKIRDTCGRYNEAAQKYFGENSTMIYASKAFSCLEICRIVSSEQFDVEVVSAGELYTALRAGVDPKKIHFQGNNKTVKEIEFALENGVGDMVIDNMTELKRVQEMSMNFNVTTNISIRIKPGIEAHTHDFIQTGQIDSKFGVGFENGEAMEMVKLALSSENLSLKGLHCHIGSQIMEKEPFSFAAKTMLEFYAEIKEVCNAELVQLNLGGGFGIPYISDDQAVPFEDFVQVVAEAVKRVCSEKKLKVPHVFFEPGRSIVGEAGITLHKVGNVKEISAVRNYVAVDGGMFENIRHALYGADYTCVIANKAAKPADYTATIVGKCCESGDVIQSDTCIQSPEEGDVLAVLSTGAYNYSMSSNYNRNLKPACIMVADGKDRVIIKGETYQDLIRNDV